MKRNEEEKNEQEIKRSKDQVTSRIVLVCFMTRKKTKNMQKEKKKFRVFFDKPQGTK